MFDWSKERIVELKQLWAEGLSSGQIAKKMGGLSRNAILGKVHRLGLPTRERSYAPTKPRKLKMSGLVPRIKAQKEKVNPMLPPEGGVAFMDLKSHHCREVIGWDPPPQALARYCGALQASDSSYCREHHRKNTVPVRIR